MCDVPENLQVIKLEPTSPTAPDNKSPNSIKARLNLHVKRRLQDYGSHHHSQDEHEQAQANHSLSQQQQKFVQITALKTEQSNNNDSSSNNTKTNKGQQRQKRPYHKRTDKAKTCTASNLAHQPAAEGTPPTPQRKYKPKFKAVLTTGNPETLTPNSLDDTHSQTTTSITGTVSAGDEDETAHDDQRQGREKEKCPDVLAMVLSMKKRSLMQDPEVQHFLAEVMKVIKS